MGLIQKTGSQLLSDLDSAFDRNLAVIELGTPPDDEKDLGHKISLLATIIDKFKGKNPNNDADIKSIRTLEIELQVNYSSRRDQQPAASH